VQNRPGFHARRLGGVPTPLRYGVLCKGPPPAEFRTANWSGGNYSGGAFIVAHVPERSVLARHYIALRVAL